jgi:hypothetical protein
LLNVLDPHRVSIETSSEIWSESETDGDRDRVSRMTSYEIFFSSNLESAHIDAF